MRASAAWLVVVVLLTAPTTVHGDATADSERTVRASPNRTVPTPPGTAPASKDQPASGGGAPPLISPREAAAHVGEEVIVEGHVHAVHVSQLATVFAFAPNFAGFTATINAADRARFQNDVHDTVRDRSVRLRGLIHTYRGRAEMTLSEPSQIVVLDRPNGNGSRRASGPRVDELRGTLARIEARLDDIEYRLATLESAASAAPSQFVPAVGTDAATVTAALGAPIEEIEEPTGHRIWVYENGRTLTIDPAGRLVAWSGF